MNEVIKAQPKELSEINRTLKNWRDGYQSEDVVMYMSAFWEEGFLYSSDMGTDADTTDDVIFEDIRTERDAAIRVFARFQDIEIELSEPPEIELNEERTQATVRNHYRIQGFVADGESLEGGYQGWFAEGDNVFTFELRDGEWRITEWHDEAFSTEEIRAANNLL
ncbi:MAG: hypothetical protein O7E52_21975 [Candidatus Poribacteria bacterium]|nr:hypothetical protein [Candidatus Poribacteria bacterium]